MKLRNKIVIGIFSSRDQTETTVDILKNAGFRNPDISVLLKSSEESKNFSDEKQTRFPEPGLLSLGVPEYEAKCYEELVGDGALMVSVHVDDAAWLNKALQILKATGAKDISSISDEAGYVAHVPLTELERKNPSTPEPLLIFPYPF